MPNLLSGGHFADDFSFFGLQMERDDAKNGLPDHFVGGIAEESYRGWVPTGDDA